MLLSLPDVEEFLLIKCSVEHAEMMRGMRIKHKYFVLQEKVKQVLRIFLSEALCGRAQSSLSHHEILAEALGMSVLP